MNPYFLLFVDVTELEMIKADATSRNWAYLKVRMPQNLSIAFATSEV